MTFEEAKKILKEEGFHTALAKEIVNQIGAIREFEKPEVCEAIKVANANKLMVCLSPMEWEVRKARLKKEYEKNTKAPAPGEEQPKENGLKAATDAFILQANEIMRLKKKNTELLEAIDKMKNGNPALAESASQFNDALLDEQAKKIKRLGKEISRLNDIIHDKNEEIKRKTKGCCELVAENVDLKEDLRNTESLLHDTREANSRNLDTCFKNEDLIDELKKKLAEKTKLAKKYAKELSDSSLDLCKLEKQLKDKDAVLSDVAEELRLSKIREKNLTGVSQKYMKENEELRKELADKVIGKIDTQALKSALAWKEKVIAEKDMALAYNEKEIADLQEKLAATKKELEGANNLVEIVRKGSKEYCEYGIAAEKMIQKMAKDIVNDRPVSPKDYEQYRHWAKGYRFNPQLPERTDEEEEKPNTSKSTLDDLKEKAYNSFNAKACNLGLVGSKDGNGIFNQIVGVDNAEEGADLSGVIVLCGKNLIDAIKKMK